tara:strand:+ start:1146 stop:1445 length:300 start_codon:yes stop_codon:yes gene_type:complete
MARYTSIPELKTEEGKKFYKNIKYPDIPLSDNDIYVTTVRGDRYDLLSNIYYNDKSLWWIISLGNAQYTQGTLYPPIGALIRIPDNSSAIQAQYEQLNS